MKKTIQTIKAGKKAAKKSTKKVEPKKKTVTPTSTPTKRNVPAKKAVTTNSPVAITKSHYQAIDNNIYFDGYSYRTRVTINGKVNSRNFSNVRAAKNFRTKISKTR
jgi:hypothetical protein